MMSRKNINIISICILFIFVLWLNTTNSAIRILTTIASNLIPPINTISIGNNIADNIEPTDTILVRAINISANIKQISPTFQFKVINTPSDVATPFPPLN